MFKAASEGPATSAELAGRAALQERYVREWLGAMVTSAIVDYDAASKTYTLPAEHAVCLTGEAELNLAPLSLASTYLAKFIEPVAKIFREGGGVPYSAYRPEFTDVMDGLSRPMFDGILIDGVVPLAGDLTDRLTAGLRAADIGQTTVAHARSGMLHERNRQLRRSRVHWRAERTTESTGAVSAGSCVR